MVGERQLQRHRADLRVRPAGVPARPRLGQPEQPAQLGLQLRRVRRRGRGPERPGHGADAERSRVRERTGRNAACRFPMRRCSSAAIHNTCNDSVTLFRSRPRSATRTSGIRGGPQRSSRRPATATPTSAAAGSCRHRSTLSFARRAREHVEERSEDLAQTTARTRARDQRHHASWGGANGPAACSSTGGRSSRRTTRRRTTPEATILTRILPAAVPGLRAGSTSSITSPTSTTRATAAGRSCRTTLAALLGVMDGAASDLRTGLPWQMVEIHEPVRSLFVIETTPEAMLRIMERNAGDRPALPERLDPTRGARPRRRRDPAVSRTAQFHPISRRPISLAPARRPRSTGTAAGATTWSSPTSSARRSLNLRNRDGNACMDYQQLLMSLGLVVVVAPPADGRSRASRRCSTGRSPKRRRRSWSTSRSSSGLLAAVAVLALMLALGTRARRDRAGQLGRDPSHYHFS